MNDETPILIMKFRSAYLAGRKALEDFSKKMRQRMFLAKALAALRGLFGRKAPIVRKYADALKHLRDMTKDQYVALFQEFEQILMQLEVVSGQDIPNPSSHVSPPPAGKNIFIIHGHDETNTLRLRILLQDHFKLNPILMMKKPGMSRALLQKYEDDASTCAFAFALMTPDDQVTSGDEAYAQARPNVVFELGWFVGRLGPARTCLLLKNGTTVHSDFDGISRIYFQDNIEEKVLEIQMELQAVGLLPD